MKHAVYPGFPGSLVEVVASRWLWVHASQKAVLRKRFSESVFSSDLRAEGSIENDPKGGCNRISEAHTIHGLTGNSQLERAHAY